MVYERNEGEKKYVLLGEPVLSPCAFAIQTPPLTGQGPEPSPASGSDEVTSGLEEEVFINLHPATSGKNQTICSQLHRCNSGCQTVTGKKARPKHPCAEVHPNTLSNKPLVGQRSSSTVMLHSPIFQTPLLWPSVNSLLRLLQY